MLELLSNLGFELLDNNGALQFGLFDREMLVGQLFRRERGGQTERRCGVAWSRIYNVHSQIVDGVCEVHDHNQPVCGRKAFD